MRLEEIPACLESAIRPITEAHHLKYICSPNTTAQLNGIDPGSSFHTMNAFCAFHQDNMDVGEEGAAQIDRNERYDGDVNLVDTRYPFSNSRITSIP